MNSLTTLGMLQGFVVTSFLELGKVVNGEGVAPVEAGEREKVFIFICVLLLFWRSFVNHWRAMNYFYGFMTDIHKTNRQLLG